MLGLWVELPWWIKVPFSLAMMGFGGYLLWESRTATDALDFGGGMVQRRSFFFGVVLLLTGLLLFVTGGRTNAEKHGYKSL